MTSLTYKQCLELDKLIAPLLLNSHSIQRNAHRGIIHLSDEFGGLDIPSIYHLQGIAKLQFLYMHYRNSNRNMNHDCAPVLPTQKVCLLSRGRVVTSMMRETLIDNFSFPTRLAFLHKHLQINATSIAEINWVAIARLLRRKGNKKGKYVKSMNNQWNTMVVNNRWNNSTNDKCPLCDKHREDNDHVLQCHFCTIARVLDELIRKLVTNLKKTPYQSQIGSIKNPWMNKVQMTHTTVLF